MAFAEMLSIARCLHTIIDALLLASGLVELTIQLTNLDEMHCAAFPLLNLGKQFLDRERFDVHHYSDKSHLTTFSTTHLNFLTYTDFRIGH